MIFYYGSDRIFVLGSSGGIFRWTFVLFFYE